MPQNTFFETTEAHHKEEKEQQQQQRLRLVVDAADFAILSLDAEGRYDTWSAGAERILGYAEAEALGRHSSLIFTPEDRECGEAEKEMRTALSEGRAEDERWHVRKDGSRFWASGVMTPLTDGGGRHVGFAKVLRDVTDRRREAEGKAFLAAIVESSRDSVVTVDFGGILTTWNRAAEELYGYRAGEAIGKSLSMLALPEDLAMIAEKIDEVRNSLEVAAFDTVRERKDGSHVHLEIVMSPVKNGGGRVIGVSTVARDVTDSRLAARELQARVVERTAALETALAERRELTGRVVRAQEEERRRISRDLHDSTGQYMAALSMELGQMEGAAAEIRLAASDATERAMNAARLAVEAALEAETAAKTAFPAESGEDASRLSVVAAQTSRLAAIAGTDAAAAAASAKTAVSVVNEAAPRIARLKSVAAALSRDIHSLAVALRPTSLDDLGLVPALTALCEEWGEQTGVVPGFAVTGLGTERLPPGVETVVYRVVQESLTNAAKYALPAGFTKVSVTLQRIGETGGSGIGGNFVSGSGGHIQAVVEDDGPGFDVEKAARSGRLGISGMRERAELAGGTLEIESEPGQGTTLFLKVPIGRD